MTQADIHSELKKLTKLIISDDIDILSNHI
jgi:hypothetical protein